MSKRYNQWSGYFNDGLQFPPQAIWQKSGFHIYECDDGAVAYAQAKNGVVVAGDPLFFSDDLSLRHRLIQNFLQQFSSKGLVCGYYFSEQTAKLFLGYRTYYAGVSSFLNLDGWSSAGYASRDYRRAMNRAESSNLRFVEVHDKTEVLAEVQSFESNWLKTKRLPRIRFMLTPPKIDYPQSDQERWFLVRKDDRLEAFLSIHPYGQRRWYLDHLVQGAKADRFAADYGVAKIIEKLVHEKQGLLCFGFNAFWGATPSSLLEFGFWLNQRFDVLYASKGLRHFKNKFSDHELKRYLVMDPKASFVKQVADIMQVTFATQGGK